MQHMLRSTLSGFLGFIIAVGLFLIMLSLLKPADPGAVNNDASIDFNFVNIKQDVITPDQPDEPQPPEMEKTTTPPAAPEIDVMDNSDSISRLPPGTIDTKSIELYKDLTSVSNGFGDHDVFDYGGGIKSGITPFYPQKALRSQTEGWVEVLIKVGTDGRVTGVSILGAEPRGVFERAAKQAVYKWEFHPKKINGEIVPYQVVQKIEFSLDS